MYVVLFVCIYSYMVFYLYIYIFFFNGYAHHRDLHVLTHSFPTRRSSDLHRLETVGEEEKMQISATIEFGDRLGERSLREMLEGKARRTPAAQQGCRCDEVRIDARQGSAAGVEEPSLLQFGNHEIANGRADRGRQDKVDIVAAPHQRLALKRRGSHPLSKQAGFPLHIEHEGFEETGIDPGGREFGRGETEVAAAKEPGRQLSRRKPVRRHLGAELVPREPHPSAEQTRKAEQSPDARLHSLMACVRRDPADEVDEPLQVESATFPKALEEGEIAPPTDRKSVV